MSIECGKMLLGLARGTSTLAYYVVGYIYNTPPSTEHPYYPCNTTLLTDGTTAAYPYLYASRGSLTDSEIDELGGVTINGVFYNPTTIKTWNAGGSSWTRLASYGNSTVNITFVGDPCACVYPGQKINVITDSSGKLMVDSNDNLTSIPEEPQS